MAPPANLHKVPLRRLSCQTGAGSDPLDIDDRERALIRRECAAAGLPIISVACVAVGLTDFNYSPDPKHIVEWAAEAHDKTAALLRAAGLRP